MLRRILLALAWLTATAALYLAMLGLELHWNLLEWRPRSDVTSAGLVLGIIIFYSTFWFLTRARFDGVVAGVSALGCVALVALGLYTLPPEPPGQGVFERAAPSPTCYRGGRLLAMCLPAVLWVSAWKRARQARPDGLPNTEAPGEFGGKG